MVEYAMILAVIALAVFAAFQSAGWNTDRAVDRAASLLAARGHGDGY